MKIGMGQLLLEGGEPERNFQRAYELIKEAKQLSCDLIVLPEASDFVWTHPSGPREASEFPGTWAPKYANLAKDHSIYLCVGLTENSGSKIYNTALLFDDMGNTLLKYRKINLLEVEFPYYQVGDTLGVVDTKFGKIGLNICSDNYENSTVIGHTLGRMGAQLILSPSSWTVEHSITEEDDPYAQKWLKPLQHLCQSYQMHIVSTTSVGYIVGGPYEGKKMVGLSLAVGPEGKIAEGNFNEVCSDLIVTEIDLKSCPFKGTQFPHPFKNPQDPSQL